MPPVIRNLEPTRLDAVLREIQGGTETDHAALAEPWRPADLWSPPDVLVAAYQDGVAIGAAWGALQAGGLARVWPAIVSGNAADSPAQQLVAVVDARLADRGAELSQCLVPDATGSGAMLMRRCGYQLAAQLLFLVGFPASAGDPAPPPPFTLRPYDAARDRPALMQVLERTYAGSLDIPAANGLRTLDQVMEGYEQSVPPPARHWFLAVDRGRTVGCLLLADHPQADQLELLYMGLCPAVRRRGWGRQLLWQALERVRRAGRSQIVLAVDEANAPARAVYDGAGLIQWDRQSLLLKQLRRPA